MHPKKINKKLLSVVLIWLGFTLALLTWWVVFSFRQLEQLKSLNLGLDTEVVTHQKMLVYEGFTLVFCLIFGAGLLFYFIYKENFRLRERRDFLSSFTHDLKTTISSLRLRIERVLSLSKGSNVRDEAIEIQKIGTRLNQQLQNALNMSYEGKALYIENVNLKKELSFMKPLWPGLHMDIQEDIWVSADSALLRNVLSNIIQNFQDHAESKHIKVLKGEKLKENLQVNFESLDGQPFLADLKNFSETFEHKRSVDSSGLGLKISRRIMRSFDGKIKFYKTLNDSLAVSLLFKVAKEKS